MTFLFSLISSKKNSPELLYLCTMINALAQSNSMHKYVVLHQNENFEWSSEVEATYLPTYQSFVKNFFLHQTTIPKIIKEKKIDVVFSLATSVKKCNCQQWVLVNDEVEMQNEKKYICITISKLLFEKITSSRVLYLKPVLPNSINSINNLQKQSIIDGFADGRNYFFAYVYNQGTTEIIAVLKAFSHFKKWQNSQMKIMLYVAQNQQYIKDKLENYKYREDVLLVQEQTKALANLVAASYAYIDANKQYAFSYFSLIAATNKVPIITVDENETFHFFDKNVLLANYDNLGNVLVEAYKNEALITHLSDKNFNKVESSAFETIVDFFETVINT
jgi:hypothetical protein